MIPKVVKEKKLAIIGAGGFAREVAWLATTQHNGLAPACFVESTGGKNIGTTVNDIPCIGFDQLSEHHVAGCVIAIGNPLIRKKIYETELKPRGIERSTLISNLVLYGKENYSSIGNGSVICAGTIITTNITIGKDVQINLDCTIGHDVVIHDYVTVSPGAHISGNVHIESYAFIGTGANIINGTAESPLVIGAGSVVAAGATVTKSVPEHTMVAGSPATVKKQLR